MNIEMNLSDKFFTLLDNGLKDIEVRLLDEKRANLKVGDTITFKNQNKTILTTVLNLKLYNSFNELISDVPVERIGLSLCKEESLSELYSFYPKEKLQKHKILAIEIKKD